MFNKIVLKYNVHGIGIYIEKSDKFWNKIVESKLANQLSGFEDSSGSLICQKMIIRDYANFRIQDLGKGVFTSENCLYFKDLFIDPKAKIAFKLGANILELWVDRNAWFSIPYMLQILFIQRNLAFVHAAAISINGKGVLLPAFGGVGKTAFISEVAKAHSVKILGDDLILMDQRAFLYPYYRPFCLYSYHKDLFPDFFKCHKVIYKKPTLLNRALRKLKYVLKVRDYSVYGYIPVSPFKLFDQSKIERTKIPLTHIFLLRKIRNISKPMICNSISPEFATNFCISVFIQEFSGLLKVISNFLIQEGRGFLPICESFLNIYYRSFRDKVIKAIDIPEEIEIKKTALLLKEIVLQMVD